MGMTLSMFRKEKYRDDFRGLERIFSKNPSLRRTESRQLKDMLMVEKRSTFAVSVSITKPSLKEGPFSITGVNRSTGVSPPCFVPMPP